MSGKMPPIIGAPSVMVPGAIPLAEQVACLQRVLRRRQRVYPGWVRDGKLPKHVAQREIAVLEAAINTLRRSAHAAKAPDEAEMFGIFRR